MKSAIATSLALVAAAAVGTPARALGADVVVYAESYLRDVGLQEYNPQAAPVALVQEMGRRVGDHNPIAFAPWQMAYKTVLEQPNSALFPLAATAKRLQSFKFVCPLAASSVVLMKSKGDPTVISSLEDARNVPSIGTVMYSPPEELLKEKGFKNLVSADNDSFNYSKLLSGHINLWLVDQETLSDQLRSALITASIVPAYWLAKRTEVCLGFSLKTSDAVVERWRAALQDMIADGTYSRIHASHNSMPPTLMPTRKFNESQ